jgi:hypothetical protein
MPHPHPVAATDACRAGAGDGPRWAARQPDTTVLRLQRDSAAHSALRGMNAPPVPSAARARELIRLRRRVQPRSTASISRSVARVHHTGIAKVREVMALDRGEQPHWRNYRIRRLPREVLVEAADAARQWVRAPRRVQDEMRSTSCGRCSPRAWTSRARGAGRRGGGQRSAGRGERKTTPPSSSARRLARNADCSPRPQYRAASPARCIRDGATGKQWLECRSARCVAGRGATRC